MLVVGVELAVATELDELFEVITLVQCKKAKPLPIVLFGSDDAIGAAEIRLLQGWRPESREGRQAKAE